MLDGTQLERCGDLGLAKTILSQQTVGKEALRVLRVLQRCQQSLERGGVEKTGAVGDHVADEEVTDGRGGEVADDLDQRVDLVLVAHGADLEEGEAGVHGQHHDGAEQHEEDVDTRLDGLHGILLGCEFGVIKQVSGQSDKNYFSVG